MIIKINLKKIAAWLLVLIWMSVIFSFSAAPATVSQNTSGGITKKITTLIVKNFTNLSSEKKEAILGQMSFFVRKTAHFTEYLILGVLMYLVLNLQNIGKKQKILLSLLFSLFYSISDEIHQLFVPGRACRATDVLIDFVGICIGVLLTALITKKLFNSEIG